MDEERPSGKSFGISKHEVTAAGEKVRANKGAPGVDEVSLGVFAGRLEDNLYKYLERDVVGDALPAAGEGGGDPKGRRRDQVRRGCLPSRTGWRRPWSRPRIGGRGGAVVPRRSYGYRPRRGALDAVGKCRERCWR